jgi:hypothetical protein
MRTLLLLLWTAALPLCAENLYVAQAAAGGNTGADCANAHAVTFFNTAGNWGAGAGKIGPGDTAHLCGTITSALAAQGDGSAGTPITILFETGAKISLPACATSGCLALSNRHYIIVDGGTNGIIENTDNGSGLGHSQDSVGVEVTSCDHCTIQNLTLRNFYVHTSASDEHGFSADGAVYSAYTTDGTNLLIQNNTIHDCHWCIWLNYGGGGSIANISILNNNIYNADHGVAMAGYGLGSGSQVLTGLVIAGNSFHDFSNWDITSGGYHHDGVHLFSSNSASASGSQIYNNSCYGALGASITSCFFFEQSSPNTLIFNNVMYGFTAPSGNFGLIGFGDNDGGGIYNNTMIGLTNNAFYCLMIATPSSGTPASFENNAMSGCWMGTAYYNTSPIVGTLNYNAYGDAGAGSVGYYIQTGTNYTLANWRTFTGKEASSLYSSSLGLSGVGIPAVGSAVISAGVNLTALGITALNTDLAGAARPSSGAWDIGAYQYVSGATTPSVTTSGPLRITGGLKIQ